MTRQLNLADLFEIVAAHCRQTIAGYKVPRQLTSVDAIKRTPAGKADYRWAKDTALADQA